MMYRSLPPSTCLLIQQRAGVQLCHLARQHLLYQALPERRDLCWLFNGQACFFCRNDARLEELNQQWQAPDPAAYVRDALIASGMTATRDVRVLGVSDADMASIRCVLISCMARMLLDIK